MEIIRSVLSSNHNRLFFCVDDENYLAFTNEPSSKNYSLHVGCKKEYPTRRYVYYPSICTRMSWKSRLRGIEFFFDVFSVQFKTQKRRQNEDW